MQLCLMIEIPNLKSSGVSCITRRFLPASTSLVSLLCYCASLST